MNNTEYLTMLSVLNEAFDKKEPLIIEWKNGLKVKCISDTGMYETDLEPGDEDYCGEYAASVSIGEIMQNAANEDVKIFNNHIEINMKSVPIKIMFESGKILWPI